MSDLLNAVLSHISLFDDRDLQIMIERKQGSEDLVIEFVRKNGFTNYDLLNFSDEELSKDKKLLDSKFRHYLNRPFIDRF